MGANTNSNPRACTAGPPSTAVSATAPEGGCTHLNANIAPIDNATAIGAASTGFVIQVAHATPITADTILPPMIDQGWASGLAGTANSSTAEAPLGATSSGGRAWSPSRTCITPAVKEMPSSAPRHDRSRSGQPSVTGEG